MPFKDPEKLKEYKRDRNRRIRKEKTLQQRLRRRKREDWLRELKKNSVCEICGEDDPICLDWHHTDGNDKTAGVYMMAHRGASKERLLEEIKKCKVLCCKCHRRIHARLA